MIQRCLIGAAGDMKKILLIAVLIVLSSLSCRKRLAGPYEFTIALPAGGDMPLTGDEVEAELRSSVPALQGAPRYSAEITILKYSTGKDVFSYYGEEEGQNGEVTLENRNGGIEAMIKVKEGPVTVDVIFVKASGYSKKEILKNFIAQTREVLNIKEGGKASP